ncbi:circadian locomoter output cycles protein kaput isoform X3 [Nasonia vitripennis]|uniref:Uncharacterized protein n=1 Tax=Nasonia vitripennis TaxID=7425 RepID=A0A7M7TBL3_NASVI|nr:circadian locomoter output cycles protein kaput isoform X3 [Nasonia vitripennis]
MWQPDIQEQYLQGMAQHQAIYRMRQIQQIQYQQQQQEQQHHHHHHHHHHQQQQQQVCGDNRMQFSQQQHPIVPPPQVQQSQPQQQQQCSGMNSVVMMDVAAHSSNPRASRNMAEKQRRDNLNTQIATMASLVPTVSNGGSRKKDKISVLRLTAAHLRVAYTLGVPSNEFLPRQFNDIDLENCLIDNLAGSTSFLLVVTTTGKIIYISRHVEQHLGHEQIDLIGDSLYNYTYEKDHEELTRGLTPDQSCMIGTSILGASDSLEDSSNSSDDSAVRPEYSNFKTQRRSFNIRMTQRTNSRRETPQYEYVLVSGVLRLANECRAKERPKLAENSSTSNDIIFVGTARLLKKRSITELSVLEANKNEYFTRHLPDGRIIFCDHRISIIAGYMSDEVSGTSAFKFMHKEDVRWTIVALREMYDGGKNYGSSCYRLMTKTGDYIYLRTHGYLEYDESANCITSFVCINTLTTEEEGEILIAEMKKRFSAITSKAAKVIRDDGFESESECSSTSHLVENIDDSSQLEDAVAHLLGDLPQPVIEDRDSPAPLPNSQLVKAAIYSQGLPPALIQANKIGIKDITNAYASFGKGGKGDKNGKGNRPSGGKKYIDNGQNNHAQTSCKSVKMYGEKKMPELEDPSSPVAILNNRALVPIAEKVFPPASDVDELDPDFRVVATLELPPIPKSERNPPPNFPSTFEMKELYTEGPSINANDDLQPPLPQQKPRQQTGLKRPYEHLNNTNNISPKKRSANNVENIVNISDSIPCVNGEYSAAYAPVQPMTLTTEIQEVQSDFKQLEANEISIALTENQFIDFQDMADDQLLNSAIENNPAIIKLFSNIPPTINLEETEVEDQNAHQYPTSDQGVVVENEVRRAHLQLADSMSSCESQFSDGEDSAIATKCDSFIEGHSDHKIQKQQLAGSQLNVQHDIGV